MLIFKLFKEKQTKFNLTLDTKKEVPENIERVLFKLCFSFQLIIPQLH